MSYLWFKAIHVFFVVSWFAALFYLPRIYVNMAAVGDVQGAEYQRCKAGGNTHFWFLNK